ncbi:MAG: DnaA/Hda family protein [Desulfuromonadia bacterium]
MTDQLVFDFPIHEEMTFDTFVVCEGNRHAVTFLHQILEGNSPETSLYIHGPSGSGKSHLLAATARLLGGAPLFSFREGDGASSTVVRSSLQRRFSHAPALLLDDFHLIPPDPAIHRVVWQLYNDYHTTRKPIVIAASTPPKDLSPIDDHLSSRLLWGLVARVDVSDDRSRRMIMKKLAADRNVVLPLDVIEYLLTRLPRSIPNLRAALDRIVRHAVATKRRITVPLAREALDMTPPKG